MPSRWKHDRPMSRAAFEARFPDEEACARHLAAKRWPDGFVCPACGHDRGWELKRRRASWECAGCGKEASVTAGTIMHRSHLPLKTWFTAIHMVTSHSNGISALQLQAQLGLGSYKSAWLLLHKLRRAMVDPGRSLLEDLVEIDEASLPQRTAQDPPTAGQGRSAQGKMLIAGAVELSPEGEPRRIRDCESTGPSRSLERGSLTPTRSGCRPATIINQESCCAAEPGGKRIGDRSARARGQKCFRNRRQCLGICSFQRDFTRQSPPTAAFAGNAPQMQLRPAHSSPA